MLLVIRGKGSADYADYAEEKAREEKVNSYLLIVNRGEKLGEMDGSRITISGGKR